MSFSTRVKKELCHIESNTMLKVSELAGIVRMDGSILIDANKNISLELVSEHINVAQLVYTGFKNLFKVDCNISIYKHKKLKKNNRYVITILNQPQIRSVLYSLGMMDEYGMLFYIGIPEELIDRDDKRRDYLSWVFLGGGSVSDPNKNYHLEIVTNSEIYAELIQKIIRFYGIETKISFRKENVILYIKESEQISDFLALIGAYEALLDFENIRINKNMRNQVNRRVNCETANVSKSVDAAQKQIQYIKLIEMNMGIDHLPESLKIIADLRLKFPEASLKELGEKLLPPIGKSGVNHRMRRLEKIAESLKG